MKTWLKGGLIGVFVALIFIFLYIISSSIIFNEYGITCTCPENIICYHKHCPCISDLIIECHENSLMSITKGIFSILTIPLSPFSSLFECYQEGCGFMMIFIKFPLWILTYFIIGSLIGLIIQKIKSKKK